MAKQPVESCPALEYVYSISRDRSCIDSEAHRHTFWELILFESGEGVHTINGAPYPLHSGVIVLLSPTDTHGWTNASGTLHDCTKVRFSYNIWHNHLKDLCQAWQFPVVAELSAEDYQKALQLLDLLYAEYHMEQQTDKASLALHLIASLLLLIKRNLPGKADIDDSKTRAILLYVQEHFCEPISITDVANALNYSPKYFSRLFTQELGIPFREYIHTQRLNYAYHLIKYSQLPITDVCYQTGFRSLAHFSKSFKSKYGLSPNHLRKNAGTQNPVCNPSDKNTTTGK